MVTTLANRYMYVPTSIQIVSLRLLSGVVSSYYLIGHYNWSTVLVSSEASTAVLFHRFDKRNVLSISQSQTCSIHAVTSFL